MNVPVHHVQGLGYIVESLSVPGAWRLVVDKTCSCPAGHARTCRHRRAVAEHCAEQSRLDPRPAGRIVPSMFVD